MSLWVMEVEDCRLRVFQLSLLLLCFSALRSSAIDTVNVVDFCGQTIRDDGMIVNSHQESKKYYFVTMGTDCHLTMQASSLKDKVQFHFRFFLVYSLLRVAPLSPAPLFPESPRGSAPLNPRLEPTSGETLGDPCHAGSYVQFYDGRDKSSPPLGPPLCGKSPPRPVLSTGNYLTLRLVTRGTQPRVDFVGDFTSFRLGFNQSECSSEPYFTCRNGKCIPLSLVCDDKGIDNCGDGSDLEENLTTGCKGQLLPTEPPPPMATPPPPFVNPPAMPSPTHKKCPVPDSAPSHESVTDSPTSLSLLILYIILGIVAGGTVLCWCCWTPGWFLWRISICRFLPCCNSVCASCQFCTHNCTHNQEHRLAKVTPHTPVNGTPRGTAATTNSAEENVATAAV
ncbi:low-density lipoprotein receptor class A domain-containing protein 2 isoform X5 [Acanthochromis polyacanthus]|uniref:low-density lipoprotein receptor class A domain-containing protein 2 isoform X4 n=1 Tax=Acanthochromis polyacanthus TaxID=80966 RepID=UPI0022344370|nr:low-density lipoprotein receptor class A domain-containing protein 2 isoform X4 [Acanthochromis polyacanthus]XP_051804037.1 low-density lipoprotein receptor class A domain-containing protein 2 isoform X5 [Acanthochromis polyacanthus]